MTQTMELSEARRRFEKLLVLAGYSMTGMWAEKAYREEKDYICSMALTNMPDTRAVLWQEGDGWAAMVAVAVGEDGEFPLMGNRLTRFNEDRWKPNSFSSMVSRIDEVRAQVRRWDLTPSNSTGYVAMMRLSLNFMSLSQFGKAKRVLLMAVRGEISQATVSEALSIVQTTLARSREERLRSALIWSSTFK